MITRNPPIQIENQLRKEALYGCIICGCPVLVYVDIIQQDKEVFIPENMVALCPIHRNKYHDNDLEEDLLRNAKLSPYNKEHQLDAFAVHSSDITVNVGKCKFVNTPRILVVDDFDIITVKRNPEDNRFILFDVNFFDSLNNLKAMLSENSWHSESADLDWIVRYEPRHLSIQKQSDTMLFDAKIDNEKEEITIIIDGFHYNQSLIQISQNEILVDKEEIAQDLKGTSVKNYEAGIMFQTR
jgi:hypothetical protein